MKFSLYITFFVSIFFENALVSEANSWRCDYTYIKSANGYFKYHSIPATWKNAWLRCKDEGAVLASPYPDKIHDALLNLMADRISSGPIYIGVLARFSKGDYYTVNGTPLSKIPIKWMINEPDNYQNQEDCLILTADGLSADKKCDDTYPYFCYKVEKEDDNMFQGSCGTTDHAYEYNIITDSCYKYHAVPRTWSLAYMACSAEGGYLAVINGNQEVEVIKNIFANNPKGKVIGNYRTDMAFIGFHDQDQESAWYTVQGETLSEAGYDKFASGEPTNILPKGQHCGCVYTTGLLCDYNCDTLVPFICEKKPNSLICTDNEEY